MDAKTLFTPQGVRAKNSPLSTIAVLKLERAFQDLAVEMEYLMGHTPEYQVGLTYLLSTKNACILAEVPVQAQIEVPAQVQVQVQVQTEPKKEEQNVEEKKPVQKGRTSRKK